MLLSFNAQATGRWPKAPTLFRVAVEEPLSREPRTEKRVKGTTGKP